MMKPINSFKCQNSYRYIQNSWYIQNNLFTKNIAKNSLMCRNFLKEFDQSRKTKLCFIFQADSFIIHIRHSNYLYSKRLREHDTRLSITLVTSDRRGLQSSLFWQGLQNCYFHFFFISNQYGGYKTEEIFHKYATQKN